MADLNATIVTASGPHVKITNWSAYNNTLRQRASLKVWFDESAIAAWTDGVQPVGRSRLYQYAGMEISTVLLMKRMFNLPAPGFTGLR